MDSKILFDNFEIIANAPGGITRLRELILDLAVRGNLVQRSIEDVWGEEIQLRDVGRMIRGVTYAKAESSKSEGSGLVPLLGAANIQREINFDGLTYVPERLIKSDQIVCDGDVLICMSSGSKHLVGKTGSISLPPRASFGAFCAVFRVSDSANHEYLAMFFKSPVYRNAISAVSRGIGINNLRIGDVESIAFVLPPIKEQKRIVARVDELMALCDELESAQSHRNLIRAAVRKSAIDSISIATTPGELGVAWKRISDNWLAIADTPESIASLRMLILDLAMKGKLVPSSTEWRECLLGEITKIRTGKLDANASSPDGAYPFFTCAKDPLRISSFSYDTECVLLAGNGNFDVNYFSGKFDAYQRTYILEARDRAELFIPFLYRFMQGHSRKLLEQSIGGVIKYIKIGFLTEAKFLLPQLDEQKMIVSKVDELMALCDQLELSLAERDELTKKISGAMAAEVAA
jgi:restriction endonuclease S subunit